MTLTSKRFLITRCHQLTKSLKMQCHLDIDDSDNDVYDDDDDDDDGFQAESQITQ